MARSTTIMLPRIAPELLAGMNRLFSGANSLSFKVGAAHCSISFGPTPLPQTWGMRLHGVWGQASFVLFLEGHGAFSLAAKFLDPDLRPEDIAAMPAEIKIAALEAALESSLSAAEKASGQTLHLEEMNLDPVDALQIEAALPFRLSIADEADRSYTVGALLFSTGREPALEKLRALLGKHGQENAAVSDASLPIRLGIMAGRTSLKLKEWQGVAPGDIILADDYYPANSGKVMIRNGKHLMASATLGDAGATIGEILMTAKDKSANAKSPAAAAEPKTDIDAGELVIDIDIEIASVSLPLAEVKAIKPGYVISTEKPSRNPVTLSVNGSAVGRGELVDIGGKVGVRVIELA